jgi:hypothetical protein
LDLIHSKAFIKWKKLDVEGKGRVTILEARNFILNNMDDITLSEANSIIH